MHNLPRLSLRSLALLLFACGLLLQPLTAPAQLSAGQKRWLKGWRSMNREWLGLHLMLRSDADVESLMRELPKFATLEINVIIAEVNYHYDFAKHPELRMDSRITRPMALRLAQAAREHGIRLIPQFNCLGHQSWAETTFPLLARYPHFDETPGKYPGNKDIYCRSWCPQHPEVNTVVFALIDELIQGFQADAVHVGMDEVFLIASENCDRCRNGDPAKLFAKAVNDLHRHIAGRRKLEMLMWADRLLDADKMGYSEWEAAKNGTHGALELISKDIILCDWHYGRQAAYPSVPFLLEKGFRVWPAAWQPVEASRAFSAYARDVQHKRRLGYLATTWGKVGIGQAADWPPITEALAEWTSLIRRRSANSP